MSVWWGWYVEVDVDVGVGVKHPTERDISPPGQAVWKPRTPWFMDSRHSYLKAAISFACSRVGRIHTFGATTVYDTR